MKECEKIYAMLHKRKLIIIQFTSSKKFKSQEVTATVSDSQQTFIIFIKTSKKNIDIMRVIFKVIRNLIFSRK